VTAVLFKTSTLLALLSAITLLAFAEGCGGEEAAERRSAYRESIDAWIEAREERLLSPTGYLSLVGLYRLDNGKSTFGSDPSNDIVFPDKVPPLVGRFDVTGGRVTVAVDSAAGVRHGGAAVETLILQDDRAEGGPTILEMGTLSWYVIRRGDRLMIRLKDSESDTRKSFEGLERFAIDERWRIDGKLEKYTPDKYIPIDNTLGLTTNERVFGAIVFTIDGRAYRLDALGSPGAEKLFVIFADATSGAETYGAGRFLYVDRPDRDGNLVIDFNKAYNPPCAFSDYTTCPLPPPQNRLPVRIPAGEKTYRKNPE
jgi:uncharacterized protein (DUF1684 family)